MGSLMDAIKKAFKITRFELYGSGRTDAGVHALGQAAHLEINFEAKADVLRKMLNDNLPATINVLKVQPVESKFHARYSAVARSYIYHISTRRTAFGKKYTYWVKDKLDLNSMKRACKLFEGMHDFKSYGTAEDEEQSTKVKINKIEIYTEGDSVYIHIIGSHFLWKMIRRMVGVIIECGRGNLKESDITGFFTEYSDLPAKLTVPPSGLFLERVFYSDFDLTYRPKWPMVIADSD
jgi:tRNA pseudouridine38-40 synthase